MFKRPFNVKSARHLRSSEWRALRSRIFEDYPSVSSLLAAVCGDKNGTSAEIVCEKIIFSTTEKFYPSLYWLTDGTPDNLLLAMEPLDGVVTPSLSVCWRLPACIPIVRTIDAVMEKLYQGADLMAPGIMAGMPNFGEGKVVGVALEKDPSLVLAIGLSIMSSAAIAATHHGKALKIIHFFGDKLWAKCGRPNPILRPLENLQGEEVEVNEGSLQGLESSLKAITLGAESASKNVSSDNFTSSQQIADEANEATAQDEDPPASEQSPDDAVREGLLMTLDEMEFPVNASTLHSRYLAPHIPGLDFKKTSFKNMTKFLKTMEKAKLVTLKERQGELLVTGFDAGHDMFDHVILPKKKKKKAASAAAAAAAAAAGHDGDSIRNNRQKQGQQQAAPTKNLPDVAAVTVENVYKSIPSQGPLFSGRAGFVGTLEEVRNTLIAGLNSYRALSSDGKVVSLEDPTVCSALHMNKKKPGNKAGPDACDLKAAVSFSECLESVLGDMRKMHRVSTRPHDIQAGEFQRVRVCKIVRQKRRVLTEITNLDSLLNLEQVQQTFSVRCASSVSIDGAKMYIQGDHTRTIQFWAAENGMINLFDFEK